MPEPTSCDQPPAHPGGDTRTRAKVELAVATLLLTGLLVLLVFGLG